MHAAGVFGSEQATSLRVCKRVCKRETTSSSLTHLLLQVRLRNYSPASHRPSVSEQAYIVIKNLNFILRTLEGLIHQAQKRAGYKYNLLDVERAIFPLCALPHSIPSTPCPVGRYPRGYSLKIHYYNCNIEFLLIIVNYAGIYENCNFTFSDMFTQFRSFVEWKFQRDLKVSI